MLEFTGGVSWLVSEALALHDERDCVDDIGHRAVMRAVEERIAHRLDTIPAPLRHEIEAALRELRSARPPPHRGRRRDRPGLRRGAADAQRPARSAGPVSRPRHHPGRTADRPERQHGRRARPLCGGRRHRAIGTGSAASTMPASARRSSSTPIGCSNASPVGPWSSTAAPSSAASSRPGIAGRRAQAAWASGDADAASTHPRRHPPPARV